MSVSVRTRPDDPSPPLTKRQQAALDLVRTLPDMATAELKALWPTYFDVAPFSIQKAILIPALAYRIQEDAFGGLSRSARSRLESVLADREFGRKPKAAKNVSKVRPGARLLRSWRGEVHEVTVTDSGFLYREKIYTSLSEIARFITGVQWSGPLFFGLRKSQATAKGEIPVRLQRSGGPRAPSTSGAPSAETA